MRGIDTQQRQLPVSEWALLEITFVHEPSATLPILPAVRIIYIMLNWIWVASASSVSSALVWLLTIKETNPGQKKYLKINAAQEMLPRRGSLAARPCAVKKETPEA